MTTSTIAPAAAEGQKLQALIGELAPRDGWSREQLEHHQAQRLRATIEHAVAASAYYRDVLGAGAADRPLAELPVLTKATMMEHYDAIVTDPRLRIDAVDVHLAGPNPGADFAGEYALITTSGSTGARGVFAYTRDELRVALAGSLRAMARLGARPGMRMIGIGAPSPLFMSRRVFASLPRDPASAPPDLSVDMPVDQLVAGLNSFRPEAMLGYPSIHALLAEEQLAGRLNIEPAAIGSGSEVLTDDHARRIHDAWGVWPGNAYVATEACPIASSCSRRVGMHVCDDLVVIESVDDDYQPVAPGSPGHRLLLTNLVNRAQPLIRYEITDAVTIAEGPNPTGMPWQRIERVDGRTAEILRMPGRGGATVELHPHHLRSPFATLEDVLQYQFAYDGERLAVALVLRDRADAGFVDRVRASLSAVLADAGVDGVGVTASRVDAIARETGGAAKFKQLRLTGRALEL